MSLFVAVIRRVLRLIILEQDYKNVEVQDNRSLGIQCKHRAIVTIEGTTKVYSNDRRGVNVDHLSLINLVQPLTKEKVFVNNGYDNQKNWLKEETNRFRKVARI